VVVVVGDEGRALILRAGTPLSRPAPLTNYFRLLHPRSGRADLGFYFFVIEDILKVVALFSFQSR
jgi:hypothetical protein